MITSEELKKVLSYNPETGEWHYIINVGPKKAGDRAGCANKRGYIEIGVKGKTYYSHRLAFLYMTGSFPPHPVDHKNLDKSNNVWTNLRIADTAKNSTNRSAPASNTSGLKGVSWDKITKKWVVRIGVKGRSFNLGRFDCPAAASFAYQIGADRFYGEFARHK